MCNRRDLIERWFADRDDGDFARPTGSEPFWVVGPTTSSRRMIYATKSTWIRAFENGELADQAGILGRYGLPAEEDVLWLLDIVGKRDLFFLGDLDPPDLMIFAWLRDRLAPANRTMSQIRMEDASAADDLFRILMGELADQVQLGYLRWLDFNQHLLAAFGKKWQGFLLDAI